jgi:hypothetical protein
MVEKPTYKTLRHVGGLHATRVVYAFVNGARAICVANASSVHRGILNTCLSESLHFVM